MKGADSIVLGLYAVFLGAVVLNGKSGDLIQMVRDDSRGFLPWLVAVLALTLLYVQEGTRRAVTPLAVLLILNVILRNYGTIEQQFKRIIGA